MDHVEAAAAIATATLPPMFRIRNAFVLHACVSPQGIYDPASQHIVTGGPSSQASSADDQDVEQIPFCLV